MTQRMCPCGSNRSVEACCNPVINGACRADSPEALMRSRYTAYTEANGSYLAHTQQEAMSEVERSELERWSKSVFWLGLEVVDAKIPSQEAAEGVVEFRARYLEGSNEVCLAERSQFRRTQDGWIYVDGRPSLRRTSVDRNGVCPCGSGKKFKKCHA